MSERFLILGRIAVAAWIGVIFFSSTSLASRWCEALFGCVSRLLFQHVFPTPSSYDWIHLLADKGLHVTLFCVLAVLLWQVNPRLSRKSIAIIACGAIIGSCSELLQRFFPGRDPAIRDVFINIGGTALGAAICAIAQKLRL